MWTKKKNKRVKDTPCIGSKVGKYDDILINTYIKVTKKNRVKAWAVVECSQCGREYEGRLDSILYDRVHCKCRKEKLSVKNTLKHRT